MSKKREVDKKITPVILMIIFFSLPLNFLEATRQKPNEYKSQTNLESQSNLCEVATEREAVFFEIRDMYRFSEIGNVSLDFKLVHE